MPAVAVVQTDRAGGAQLGGGQQFFYVEEQIVVVLYDPVQGHGVPPHSSPVMAESCDWFFLQGIPACRQGDRASCGHPSTGREWFYIE